LPASSGSPSSEYGTSERKPAPDSSISSAKPQPAKEGGRQVSVIIRSRDIAHDIASELTSASVDSIERAEHRIRWLGLALIPDSASDPLRFLERTHDLGKTRGLVQRLAGEIVNFRYHYFHQRGDDLFEAVRVHRRVGPGLGGRGGDYDPLARGVDRARGGDRDLLLATALDQARAIAQDLDSIELDASGEDLSGIKIRHLDAVDGITWTRETTWPPAITADVEENSYDLGSADDPDAGCTKPWLELGKQGCAW
jgi:hypothetical protein